MTLLCLRHFNAFQITLKYFTVKKIIISNARFKKVEKLHLSSDFRSIIATNLSGESHLSNFGAQVCGYEDTYCTPCFHCRTGCSTFTNVENALHWRAFLKLFQIPRRKVQHSDSFFSAEYEYVNHFCPARPDFPKIYVKVLKITLNSWF